MGPAIRLPSRAQRPGRHTGSEVVDADSKVYCDETPHAELLRLVARRVVSFARVAERLRPRTPESDLWCLPDAYQTIL